MPSRWKIYDNLKLFFSDVLSFSEGEDALRKQELILDLCANIYNCSKRFGQFFTYIR